MKDEARRAKSELIYRTVAEDSPDLIALFDAQLRHLYVNPAAARAGSLAPGEYVGKTLHESGVPEEVAQVWERRLREVLDTGRILEVEDSFPTPGGIRHFQTRIVPVDTFEGDVRHVLSIARDVTERKLAQEALRESEDKFKYVFERSTLGKSITFPTGELHVNRAFCDMLGFSPEELRERKWQEVSHPDDIATTQAAIDPVLAGQADSCQLNKRYLHKDGSVVWGHVSTSLRRDAAGRPLYFITSVMNITDRVRVEQSLERHVERLRILREVDQAILAATESPEAIASAALGHLRNMLLCQRASVGMLESDLERARIVALQAEGATVAQIEELPLQLARAELDLLRQGKAEVVEDLTLLPSPPVVTRILRAEGVRACVNVPLISADKLLGALSLGWDQPRSFDQDELDIAREVAGQIALAIEQARLRKQAVIHAAELEQRVADRTAQLDEANRELEAFTFSVSHDLRAPLRAVDGFVRILLEEHGHKLDTEGKRVCSVISEGARKMGKLIDDLLAFSRVGRASMAPSSIDMAGLVRSVFFELTTPESRKRIDFLLGEIPRAMGDPALVRQLWVNLLDNALKFSTRKDRAVIEVSAEQRGDEVVHSIRDNGAGFDMAYAEKLFGVFERLHTEKEFEGTGVGLAIVQRIIHRHGGRVWAEGEPGKGATFHFSIKNGGT